MGNISSIGGGSSDISPTIPATDVLRLVAQEEAATGRTVRLVGDDCAPPEESELPGALSALGVDMGEASLPGETSNSRRMPCGPSVLF